MRTLAIAALTLVVAAPCAEADRPGADGAKMTAVAWLNAPRKQPPAIDDAVAMTEVPFWYDGATVGDGDACKAIGGSGEVSDRAKLAALATSHALVLGHGRGKGGDAWAVIAVAYDRAASATTVGAFAFSFASGRAHR